MPLFIKWVRGGKSGKTGVEWEENGGVLWEENNRFVVPVTLFFDSQAGAFQSKTLVVSVERHVSNKKSICMGKAEVELMELADEKDPVISKRLKLSLVDGPLAGALLRVVVSSRCTGESNGSDDDDDDFEDPAAAGKSSGEEDARCGSSPTRSAQRGMSARQRIEEEPLIVIVRCRLPWRLPDCCLPPFLRQRERCERHRVCCGAYQEEAIRRTAPAVQVSCRATTPRNASPSDLLRVCLGR